MRRNKLLRYTFIIILQTISISFWGQTDSIKLRMTTLNSFTRESIKSTITFMDSDSTIIKTDTIRRYSEWLKFHYLWATLPYRHSYILKAECEGYEPTFVNVTMGKNEEKKILKDILMNRDVSFMLNEVTVKASKVRMVYDGDTITYNAQAFKLSNGSLLDDLVRSLPGVELDDNGIISVNGERVSELLVNGRNFFKGEPVVALRNLPAYYVDKIKSYHKVTKYRQFMYGDSVKADANKDPLVMDVILKRDYNEGWIANVEAARGTDDLYLYRLFSMRYTKHSGLFAYGNINNINDAQSANRSGLWGNNKWKEGLTSYKIGGINFNWDDKVTKSELDTKLKVSYYDGKLEQKISTDTYLAGGDNYARVHSFNEDKTTDVNWDAEFTYPGRDTNLYFRFKPYFNYSRHRSNGFSHTVNMDVCPTESYIGATVDSVFSGAYDMESIINRQEAYFFNKTDRTEWGGSFNGSWKYKVGKAINFSVSGSSVSDKHESSSVDGVRYNQHKKKLDDDLRNNCSDMPSASSKINVSVSSRLLRSIDSFMDFNIKYDYGMNSTSNKRNLYRLDKYIADDSRYGSFGHMPSTSDSLQMAIDIKNSFDTSISEYSHKLSFHPAFMIHKLSVSMEVPVKLINQKIEDYRDNLPKSYSHQKLTCEPEVTFNWIMQKDGNYKDALFMIKYREDLIPMLYYLECRDTSNPLSISLGNANLKKPNNIGVWLNISNKDNNSGYQSRFEWTYTLTKNAISMGRTYESASGRSIYKPQNIDGNWNTYLGYNVSLPLNKAKNFTIANNTSIWYVNSCDYLTEVKDLDVDCEPVKNTVRNLRITENASAKWLLNSLTLLANGKITYSHSYSSNLASQIAGMYDINYGLTATKEITKDIDIKVESSIWMHRGYADKSMNTNEFITNIDLSYACLKNRQLILKLICHDLFNQINSVYYSLNAQGRVEKWYDTLHSYYMLSATYRFNKKPKKNVS